MAGRRGGRGGGRGDGWVFPAVVAVTAVAGVLAASQTSSSAPWVFLVVIGGWVITLCLHEFAHALASLAGGDDSVRARGYLSLNPLRYTDPATSLVIPLLLLAVGGIPLPGGAVLVEPGRLRRPWWSSVVSAVGPLTNLLCGVVLSVVGAGLVDPLGAALSFLGLLQFVAGILNLLPVPGFDGFGIIARWVPAQLRARIRPVEPWLPLAVFVLLFGVPQVAGVLFDAGRWLLELSGGDIGLAGIGQALFRFWQ